jgi:hypothetical protein
MCLLFIYIHFNRIHQAISINDVCYKRIRRNRRSELVAVKTVKMCILMICASRKNIYIVQYCSVYVKYRYNKIEKVSFPI